MALSILVVEDSRAMRTLVVTTLHRLGEVRILEADNGFVALKALPSARFDLIITDVNLPEITGLEIVRFVRQHPVHARVPILIISTQQSEADVNRGLQLGASAYLGKPFEPAHLIAAVRQLLPSLSSVPT
jgi:two-component system, chemotaxis family, chemotaxis protein CheY